MAEFVTFVGRLSTGELLSYVAVTAYSPTGALLWQETFDLRTPGVAPTHVLLPAGEYLLTAVSDGVRFPLHFPVVIPEGAGPTARTLLTIDLVGVPSTPPAAALPCRVYGWVDQASPSSLPGGSAPVIGTQVKELPSMKGHPVSGMDVWFRLFQPVAGEVRSVTPRARTRVAVDRHGYFEAQLVPNALYSVALPDVAGVRYIRTPGPGEEAEVTTLVDATATVAFDELV